MTVTYLQKQILTQEGTKIPLLLFLRLCARTLILDMVFVLAIIFSWIYIFIEETLLLPAIIITVTTVILWLRRRFYRGKLDRQQGEL